VSNSYLSSERRLCKKGSEVCCLLHWKAQASLATKDCSSLGMLWNTHQLSREVGVRECAASLATKEIEAWGAEVVRQTFLGSLWTKSLSFVFITLLAGP
jgi:hypothetical protein